MIKWLMNEESGQGMVEYGLIIALVSLLAIAGLKVLGGGLSKRFKDINNVLQDPENATPGAE